MRAYIAEANAKSKTGKPVLHRKPDREWAGNMPKSKMPGSSRPSPGARSGGAVSSGGYDEQVAGTIR